MPKYYDYGPGYCHNGGYGMGYGRNFGDIDRILSSKRVHIEKVIKCECESEDYEEYNECGCCCEKRIHEGFDGKHDRVAIEVDVDCDLKEQTRYLLVLSQPVPVDGFNLPVDIKVHFCDKNVTKVFPLKKGYEIGCGIGDIEYGEDLPRCKNRIPVYFTNSGDFIDLRKCQCPL